MKSLITFCSLCLAFIAIAEPERFLGIRTSVSNFVENLEIPEDENLQSIDSQVDALISYDYQTNELHIDEDRDREPVRNDEDTLYKMQERLLDAMIQVESSGRDDAVGDNGNAIGPLQIWRVYWLDANEYKYLGGTYEDCFNRSYAKWVVHSYMERYAKEKWTDVNKFDPEYCARIHNGGPRGNTKHATVKYWIKVQKELLAN